VLAEDLSSMQLRVNVDEADVGQVHPGQRAAFTVDAYPGRAFPASVERIDLASTNTASTAASGTNQAAGQANSVVNYEARLSVANPDGLLRPGMTATATIATERTATSLLVPNGALRFNPEDAAKAQQGGGLDVQVGLKQEEQKATIGVGSRQHVYVLGTDGTPQKIDVVVGQSDGRLTTVSSSKLKPGMKVITGVKAKDKKKS
jgi:HlyD family secretion protein